MGAEVRSNVTLNCSVLYDPNFDLTVTWKKDNVDLDLGQPRFALSVEGDNHRLVIMDLKFDDAGRTRDSIFLLLHVIGRMFS